MGRIYNGIVLFEENSILLLPECSEASGVEFSWGEVSQESLKNQEKSVIIGKLKAPWKALGRRRTLSDGRSLEVLEKGLEVPSRRPARLPQGP